MSSDKVSRTNKSEEVWYRLLLNDDFSKELKKLLPLEEKPEFYIHADVLFKKYKTPLTPALIKIMRRHLFNNDTEIELGNDVPVRLQTPSEEELKNSDRAFLKLWIYDGVSRDEVLNYVKRNWSKIKFLHSIQDTPKVKRIRITENKKQNELVLKYNKLSTKKLMSMSGTTNEKSQYREILIQRLLKKDGFIMSTDAIKSIISRFPKASNQA